ncbi:hypothetical protein [Paenibacillus larvae]|nr:hypothetical protein [Paenibacillus larvae]
MNEPNTIARSQGKAVRIVDNRRRSAAIQEGKGGKRDDEALYPAIV